MTDATHSASPADVAAGTVLDGRFVLDERLAHAPAGMWYRAHHAAFGTPVRIFVADAFDAATAAALRSQARFARGLRLHRHMARVFDVGELGARSVVVEEPIAGVDFTTWVAGARAGDVAAVGRQLVDALAAAHAVGMVHGGVSADAVRVEGVPPHALLCGFGTSVPGATARDDVRALAALLHAVLGDEVDAAVASPDAGVALERLESCLAARVSPPAVVSPPVASSAAPVAPAPVAPAPAASPSRAMPLRWIGLGMLMAAVVVGMRLCEPTADRREPATSTTTLSTVSSTAAVVTTAPPATTDTATTAAPATPTSVSSERVTPTTTATVSDTAAAPSTRPLETPPTTTLAAASSLRWRSWSPAGDGETAAAVGEPLAFEVATDGDRAGYRWTVDGKETSRERTWTLQPEAAQLGSTLVVRAEARDDAGEIAHEWRVRIEPARVRVTGRVPAGEVVAIAAGGSASFSLDVTVPPTAGPVTFTWLRNGRVVASGSRPLWTLVSARSGDRRVAVTAQDGAGRTYGPYVWRTLVRDEDDDARDDGDDAERDESAVPAVRPDTAGAADRPRVLAASPGAGGIVPVRQSATLRFAVEVAGGGERRAQWWLDGVRRARGRVCRVAANWPVGTFHHLQVEVPGRTRGTGTTLFWTLEVVPAP